MVGINKLLLFFLLSPVMLARTAPPRLQTEAVCPHRYRFVAAHGARAVLEGYAANGQCVVSHGGTARVSWRVASWG